MKTEAGRLKHQVEYEIKKIFLKALEIEAIYRSKYSGDAMLQKLKISRNPLNYILYKFIISVQKIGEYFEK